MLEDIELTVDLVVKNGKIVTQSGVLDAGVAVDDGKIVAIAVSANLPAADKVVDAKQMLVMPGAIDTHVHYGLYNGLEEDLRDSTLAQAIGGVTTSFHMKPDARSYRVGIPEMVRAIDNNSRIDVAPNMTVMSTKHISELPYAVEQGITSFKHFWNRPEYEFLGIQYLERGQIHDSFRAIKELGGVAMNHCEDFEITKRLTEELKASGANGLAAWNDCRPDYCELVMIWQAAIAAKITGCPMFIVHTTIANAKDVVQWARNNGVEMYWETTPTYLHFVKTDKIGPRAKVNPPVRTRGHSEAIWQGIMEGWIDCIGTDHCPIPLSLKLPKGEDTDIWDAGLAFNASETMLPFMISEAFNKRGLSIERIAQLTATNAAKIHGLVDKGSIVVGNDADMVIVDPKKTVRIDDKLLHYSSIRDWSLFEGESMTGFPVMTILRGKIVAQDGECIAEPGYGKMARHTPFEGPRKPSLTELVN